MKLYTLLTLFLFGISVVMAESMSDMSNSPANSANSNEHQHMAAPSMTPASAMDEKKSQPVDMQTLLSTMQNMVQTMQILSDKLTVLSANQHHDDNAMQHDDVMSDTPVTAMRRQEHEVRSLMDKVQQTTDATERQKLMQAHLKGMQDMMAKMKSKKSDEMSGHDHSSQDSSEMSGMDDMGDMMKMMKKMKEMKKMKMGGEDAMSSEHQGVEQRLDELQFLLEQLLQHQIQSTK